MNEEKLFNLLSDILNEMKKQNESLENLTNLFIRYDLEIQSEAMEISNIDEG